MTVRLAFLTILMLGCVTLRAGNDTPSADEEAEGRLADAALARYAAPGDASRYKTLVEQIKQPPEGLGAPALNLRLPVRSFPDGRPQVVVHAEQAWVAADLRHLRGRKVRMVQFDETGAEEATLEAEEAIVDRTEMLAVAKGTVNATFGKDRLSGNGAVADLNARYVKVLSRAKIVTPRTQELKLTERGLF